MAMLIGLDGVTDVDPSESASDLANALSSSLDGLLAMGDMLARQPLSTVARDQLNAMLGSGRRMARLLEDIQDVRSVGAAPDLEATSLRELLDQVDTAWRSGRPDEQCQVLISCAFQPDVRVTADMPLLKRFFTLVIESAAENAVSGMVDLQISAAVDAGGDILVQGRMESLRPAVAGDGVRLDLCSALARHLHGQIRRGRSRGAGDYIAFTLRLPAAEDDAALRGAEEESPLPPRTHLLIVDDNATNRMVAAALCDMFGCTSETAEDGLEAVQAVRSRPFDLILMDIKMPRMDGLAATKAIRALGGAAAKTPIVALTANADRDAVASYLACGMVAVVDKPIKPAQLLNALQEALSDPEETLAAHAPAA